MVTNILGGKYNKSKLLICFITSQNPILRKLLLSKMVSRFSSVKISVLISYSVELPISVLFWFSAASRINSTSLYLTPKPPMAMGQVWVSNGNFAKSIFGQGWSRLIDARIKTTSLFLGLKIKRVFQALQLVLMKRSWTLESNHGF